MSMLTICDRKYKPIPPGMANITICVNGTWTPTPTTCSRACPSLRSSLTTKIKCKLGGNQLNDCTNPVSGTIAEISCEPLYEEESLIQNPTRVCRDGTWDYPISQCYPICGEKAPKGQLNILIGVNATIPEYPWQIGVYDAQKNHICGGAILNQRAILSAAHCFTNNGDGIVYPKENYLIAAGKYYRAYDDPRDTKAQYSTIDAIHVPQRYKGTVTNFADDIAVVILTTPLDLSTSVQPVCLDLANVFEYEQLVANNYGVITGWRFTKEGMDPSDELKEVSVPYIPYERCWEDVPKSFRKFLTNDKICTGYVENGTAVCGGDSGGALVFPRRSNERYYVRGVVSTSPARRLEHCDSNQYRAYTLVSKHLEFVKDLLTLNRSP